MAFPFSLSTPTLLLALFLLSFLTTPTSSTTFNCSTTTTTTCRSLIDYVPANATTLNSIKTLFNVTHLRTLLGANNLSLSTSPTQSILAGHKVLIPFTCICSNGIGVSNKRPQYIVKPRDDLYSIATNVFVRLVTNQEIAAVNKIPHPDLIQIGQKLWIPLPCSCDEVAGNKVVHYGHVVEPKSSVEAIATKYGTTQEILLRINGIADPKTLQANQVLDVPLKACASSISNNSLDAHLLVSNNTYIFTANDCVKCQCRSANNWTLRCDPSDVKNACPSMQCQGSNQLFLGNTTSSSCNQTTCAYAGYTNQTNILTTLETLSTCAAPGNTASKMGMQGSSWNFLFVAIHLVLLFHVLH